MAGSIVQSSDRNSYSQSNVLLQNDYSSSNNNESLDKDKTPMCLVNELARFNKVVVIPCLNNSRIGRNTKNINICI